MDDSKACKHGRLSMNACADCGAEAFHLPPFPGRAEQDVVKLDMKEEMVKAKELAGAIVDTITEYAKGQGGLKMYLAFVALRQVRDFALGRASLSLEEVETVERGVDMMLLSPPPEPAPPKEENH